VHLSDRGRLVAGTRDRPGPELPWLGNEGRLKGIKNWLRTYQGTDLNRPRKEQTQQQACYNGAVLNISDEKSINWGDYYQNRLTLKDSRATRTAVRPQENNARPEDYVQIRSWPTDKAAKAREDYYQNRLTLGDGHRDRRLRPVINPQAPQQGSAAGVGCSTRGQSSSEVGEGTQVTAV